LQSSSISAAQRTSDQSRQNWNVGPNTLQPSYARSLRYELKETGISVTALQPGPTDTDFFHRAGMDDTEVGQKGKSESQPDEVARQGIDALLAGKHHVYAASFKTKLEGALANVIPDSVKGAMHEKMAKPNSEK
jgi:short-subunit dehydrogenase